MNRDLVFLITTALADIEALRQEHVRLLARVEDRPEKTIAKRLLAKRDVVFQQTVEHLMDVYKDGPNEQMRADLLAVYLKYVMKI